MRVKKATGGIGLVHMLKEFCTRSTIHGISYVSDTHSPMVALLWVLILLAGFFGAITVFKKSVDTWDESPMITTIDTFSKPISDIQFPTLTICQQRPSEMLNWPLVEKVANFLRFECFSRQYGPPCNTTEYVRKEFSFLLDQVFDTLASAVDKVLAAGETLTNLHRRTEMFTVNIAEAVGNNQTDFTRLGSLLRGSLGKVSFRVLFESLGYTKEDGLTLSECEESPSCASNLEEARNFVIKAQVICTISGMMPFGSLLSNFAPLFYNAFDKHQPPFKSNWVECEGVLSPEERKIHDLFAKFSSLMGIGSNDSTVSLFDVPQMLGRISFATLFNTNKRNDFVYTRCAHAREATAMTSRGCSFLYEQWLTDGKKHPCHPPKDEWCCNFWSKKVGDDLGAVMRVMKHSLLAGRHSDDLHHLMAPFNVSAEGKAMFMELWRIAYGPINDPRDALNPYSMLPLCVNANTYTPKTKGGRIRSFMRTCTLFQPVMTNVGLCYAFNALPMAETMRPSKFTESFRTAFKPEMEGFPPELQMGKNAEDHNAVVIYLDKQKMGKNEWRGSRSADNLYFFSVGINDAYNWFDMRSQKVNIRLGYETVIDVLPNVLTSADNLIDIPLSKRNCFFRKEGAHRMRIFTDYTQAGCQFECMMNQSRKMCHCTPWDFPFDPDDDLELCDTHGYYCYEVMMRNASRFTSCDCPADCEFLSFSTRVSEIPIDAEKFCGDKDLGYSYSVRKAIQMSSKFLFNFNSFVFGDTYGTNKQGRSNANNFAEMCKAHTTSDLAIVKVKFGTDKTVVYKQGKRAELADKMASFGGTMGLFTGMSFISIIEIAFWIVKALSKSMRS